MKLITINENEIRENIYIYYDEVSKEGVVIDPGYNKEEIMEEINHNGIKIVGILITHGHFDHIGEANAIKEYTKANIFCHKLEEEMLISSKLNLSSRVAGVEISIEPDELLEDDSVIILGNTTLRTIHTPGHSMGGVCFYDEENGVIFAGDTLFKGTIGRTDLYGGNHDILLKSIEKKLFTLPDDTEVHSGHGSKTTIGKEKRR